MERWARELSARLPALRPGRLRRARAAAALVHRAGHAWEQLALPCWQPAARPRCCSALPTSRRWPSRATWWSSTTPPRCAIPSGTRAPMRAWQRARAAGAGASGGARRDRIRVLARRAVELLGLAPERVSVVPGGVDDRLHAGADPRPPARVGLERPYVLCVAAQTARKNLRALCRPARALAAQRHRCRGRGRGRPQFAREQGLDQLRLLGHVDDALLPGPLRRRPAFVLPTQLRGLRPAAARGDGLRDARRRRRRGRAARDLRRCRAAGGADGRRCARRARVPPRRRG